MTQNCESITPDFDGKFPPQSTRSILTKKFLLFREDREKIRRRMENYVLDYPLHETGATRKYELLEEQYSVNTPNLNHLIFSKGGSSLWSARDIAIVLGRNVSSVSRTLKKMYEKTEWAERLTALSVTPENPGRDAVTLYHSEVFDTIVDYFEYGYLERITHPRNGIPMMKEEREAVFTFWRALKKTNNITINEYTQTLSLNASRESSLAAIYENLRMIIKHAFSIKMGTFFLLLVAMIYEMSRRYAWFNIVMPILSLLTLISVLIIIPRRKRPTTPWLLDTGAGAIMFCLLWILATIATPDGIMKRLLPSTPLLSMINPAPQEAIVTSVQSTPLSLEHQAPNIKVSSQKPEIRKNPSLKEKEVNEPSSKQNKKSNQTIPTQSSEKIKNGPERMEKTHPNIPSQKQTDRTAIGKQTQAGAWVEYSGNDEDTFDVWIRTQSPAKEILYRLTPSGDFKSTGFSKDKTPDGWYFPIRALTLRKKRDILLSIKYIGIDGEEHGPYEIKLRLDVERGKEIQNILDKIDWVDFTFDDKTGTNIYTRVPKELKFRLREENIVARILYGINRKTPNMERKLAISKDGVPMETLVSLLLNNSKEKVWFVSVQIFFSDGTSTETRIFDNPDVDLYEKKPD
ncbi:MAG: hypothetical protein KBF14_05755 [Synergistaceae bacterium]|nr:hypothetical protein [Synergistaceae bacterium]